MPNPVDVHVGKKLRMRRAMLGFSQERLGGDIGVTFQQVQKYERGTNRIGASRLYHLSKILKVSPNYFFEDFSDGKVLASGLAEESVPYEADLSASRESQQLLQAYYKLPDRKTRKLALDMVRAMATQQVDA